MSQLKVNSIVDASGGSNAVLYGPASPAGSMGFRNRIINGDMRIDQRNAGASVTLTSSGNYTVDRFVGFEDTDGAMTAQQDTSAPAGFVNSVKITTTTADASLGATQFAVFQQKIEGTNCSDLAWGTASAKTVTLSFWVRSSLTGTFGGVLGNNSFNRSYPFTYTISSANTWEYKTVTVQGDTTGTWLTTTSMGILVNFSLGSGSTYTGTAGSWAAAGYFGATGETSVIGTLNATWYITGVQLEVGSVATEFERRPYGTELALCQRYYQKSPAQGSAPANQGQDIGDIATAINANEALSSMLKFPVVMRTTPTLTMYRPNAGVTGADNKWSINLSGGWAATTDSTYNSLTDNAVQFYFTKSGSFTFGQSYLILGAYALAAEL